MTSRVEGGSRGFDCCRYHRGYLDRMLAQFYPSARQPFDVQHIIHQPHQMIQLSFDDVARLAGGLRLALNTPELTDASNDRAQGIAQLLAERDEEAILVLIGLAQ